MGCGEFAASPRGETPRREWGYSRCGFGMVAGSLRGARLNLIPGSRLGLLTIPIQRAENASRMQFLTPIEPLRCGRTPHSRCQELPDRPQAQGLPSLDHRFGRVRARRPRGARGPHLLLMGSAQGRGTLGASFASEGAHVLSRLALSPTPPGAGVPFPGSRPTAYAPLRS